MAIYDKKNLQKADLRSNDYTYFFNPRARLATKLYNSYFAYTVGRVLKPFFNLDSFLSTKRLKDWQDGGVGKAKDPTPFLTFDETGLAFTDELMKIAEKDFRILDLCCNTGRHMNFLYQKGYRYIDGVDIMSSAFEIGSDHFKELYSDKDVNFYCQSIQDFLLETPNKKYNLLYTVGSTVELINPYYPLIREICRVSSNYVAFCIVENDDEYPRFWEQEFLREGFILTRLLRPISDNKSNLLAIKNSILIFRRISTF